MSERFSLGFFYPVVLNENSLWYLLNELNEIRVKWKYIGLGLGVSQSDLDAMKGSPLECLRCMLTEWLKGINPQPSLDTLIKVLKEPVVNERKKAKELEENFRCSFSTTVTGRVVQSIRFLMLAYLYRWRS